MTTITLGGLQSVGGNETRALGYITVSFDDKSYDWQTFIPPDVNLTEYLESVKEKIADEIRAKEAEWEALTPKTRTRFDPFNQEEVTVNIDKSEIVRPDIPDYYAKRREEYPLVGDQLGALWKGLDSPEYADMQAKIQAVKNKYPKP